MAKKRTARTETATLRAAAKVFRLKGFAGATVREIAREAGLLPGSLHYRYPTKEALLLALMEQAVTTAVASVRRAIVGVGDPVERVRHGLRAHLELLVSGDDAVYVLLNEWRSLEGDARAAIVRLRDRYEAFWDGMLHEAAGAGRLRRGVDLGLVRRLGFAAVNGVADWYRPDGRLTPQQIADAFWACMGFGVMDEAHRPSDVQAAFHGLSALDPAACGSET